MMPLIPFVQCPKTKDGFELHFGTNHLGHFLLTKLMLDSSLGKSEDGRVIVVSSSLMSEGKIDFDVLAYKGRPGPPEKGFAPTGYCDSKLANALFAKVKNMVSIWSLQDFNIIKRRQRMLR